MSVPQAVQSVIPQAVESALPKLVFPCPVNGKTPVPNFGMPPGPPPGPSSGFPTFVMSPDPSPRVVLGDPRVNPVQAAPKRVQVAAAESGAKRVETAPVQASKPTIQVVWDALNKVPVDVKKLQSLAANESTRKVLEIHLFRRLLAYQITRDQLETYLCISPSELPAFNKKFNEEIEYWNSFPRLYNEYGPEIAKEIRDLCMQSLENELEPSDEEIKVVAAAMKEMEEMKRKVEDFMRKINSLFGPRRPLKH